MEVDGRWVYFPSPDCLWVAYNLDGLLHIQFNDGTVRKTECPMTGFFMLIKDNCVYFHKKYDVEGTLYNVSEDTHVSIDISDRKGISLFRNGYLCFTYDKKDDNGTYCKHIHKYGMNGLYVGTEP